MKPHPKIRKTVKWAGVVVSILIAVVWFGTAWWKGVTWGYPYPWNIKIGQGCVIFQINRAQQEKIKQELLRLKAGLESLEQEEIELRATDLMSCHTRVGELHQLQIMYDHDIQFIEYKWRWVDLDGPGLFKWFSWQASNGAWGVQIPFCVLLFSTVTFTIAAARLDARARRHAGMGCCLCCGYSRRGLPAQAVCPECGEADVVPRVSKEAGAGTSATPPPQKAHS